MKTIKTRNSVKGIKVLDKSVNLSSRMKNSFVRTKERAEETQNSSYDSPTDYASSNIQNTAQGAVQETAHHLPNPRQKASENWNRAKGHFKEAKNQMPKERRRAAEQAQKTAHNAQTNADRLQKTADHAKKTARDAKEAVRDAKQTLSEVRQSGRQTLREVRQSAKVERSGNNPAKANPGRERFIRNRRNQIKTRSAVKGEMPQPHSGISEIAPNSGGNPRRDNFIKRSLNKIKTRNTVKGEIPRHNSGASDITPGGGVKPANTTPSGSTAKGGVSRPNYLSKGVSAPKNTSDAAKSLEKTAKTVKSTKKGFKKTAKGTVKTAKKSVKTAEKSAKAAVKTAQKAAKTAQKSAQAAAKAAKIAAKASRAAAKAAVQAAKVAAKAIAALVKAAIAAIKGLIAAIAAGGWVAVLIILIICLIGLLVGSIFGIFFSSEPSESGKTINGVITEINTEYTDKIDGIIAANAYDLLDMSGARASWKQVLAVYTVKTVTDPDNPMEVATMDDEKAAILKTVFWDMNTVSHTVDTVEVEEDVLDDDGLPTGETTTVTKTVLRIVVSHKTPDEMVAQYGFTDEQKEWLEELLKPEYHGLWNGLLYGITTVGDGSMIEIADTQIGNIGGEPYWSWYGFTSRVEWCACFVSWCAEQCGFIDAGIIPKFSGCSTGVQWFKDRAQWQDNTYTPRPGDIIFFDWEPDGECDHVGIVESVADGKVNTIEGNSSDSCRRRSYDLGIVKIYGYGCPAYN